MLLACVHIVVTVFSAAGFEAVKLILSLCGKELSLFNRLAFICSLEYEFITAYADILKLSSYGEFAHGISFWPAYYEA